MEGPAVLFPPPHTLAPRPGVPVHRRAPCFMDEPGRQGGCRTKANTKSAPAAERTTTAGSTRPGLSSPRRAAGTARREGGDGEVGEPGPASPGAPRESERSFSTRSGTRAASDTSGVSSKSPSRTSARPRPASPPGGVRLHAVAEALAARDAATVPEHTRRSRDAQEGGENADDVPGGERRVHGARAPSWERCAGWRDRTAGGSAAGTPPFPLRRRSPLVQQPCDAERSRKTWKRAEFWSRP